MSQHGPLSPSPGVVGVQQIRAIIFQENGVWVGQCIEYDICAQGNNLADLTKRLLSTICYECERSVRRNGSPFAGIAPAPAHFEEMWGHKAGDFTPADDAATQRVICRGDGKIGLEMGLCA